MKSTQAQRVLNYIETFGSITQMEALNDLGVMRLGIKNLRSEETGTSHRERDHHSEESLRRGLLHQAVSAERRSVMIKVGQKVKYDPLDGIKGFALSDLRTDSIGTVVYINEKHRWFSVVNDESKLRTSFHFCQIGKEVKVCG